MKYKRMTENTKQYKSTWQQYKNNKKDKTRYENKTKKQQAVATAVVNKTNNK